MVFVVISMYLVCYLFHYDRPLPFDLPLHDILYDYDYVAPFVLPIQASSVN